MDTLASTETSHSSEVGTGGPVKKPGFQGPAPWWAQVYPFFLSAVFFLSTFFAIFAPLPILFFYLRKGWKWAYLAAITNGIIVGILGGSVRLGFYLVFVIALAVSLSELLRRKKAIEIAVVFTLLVMSVCASMIVLGYSGIHHLNPILALREQVSGFVDLIGQSIATSNSSLINPGDAEDWKKSLFIEFPSACAISALVLVWTNLVLILRANPNGVREKLGLDPAFLKKWKAPEHLVWPTIFSGAFLVVDFGIASDVALNVFKFLMAIYAIQGLSILSYFFDLWGVKGILRLIGFSLSLFLMMPLILSLGFFDLWFDFRSKFKQA